MIASLNFRKKNNLTGEKRPILYSLRLWRKSVAFALEEEKHPDFFWLRYEDLVESPLKILNRVAYFLGIKIFPSDILKEDIRDQYGNLWKSNSSFDSHTYIAGDSIGRYKSVLPEIVGSYIESCCFPEMKYLGYDFNYIKSFDNAILYNFKEPFAIAHEKFQKEKEYSLSHIDEEIERYYKLTRSNFISREEAKEWFIFESVYERYLPLFK
jgi:hypothetical protein